MSHPDNVLWVDGRSVRRGKGSVYAVADQPCVAEEIAQAVNSHAALVALLEECLGATQRESRELRERIHQALSAARQP